MTINVVVYKIRIIEIKLDLCIGWNGDKEYKYFFPNVRGDVITRELLEINKIFCRDKVFGITCMHRPISSEWNR